MKRAVRRIRDAYLFFFAALFVVSRLALFGGEIRVVLIDHKNKPVHGAQATLKQTQTGVEAVRKAGKKGRINFEELDPGTYLLEAGAKDHISAKAELLELSEDDVEVTLKLPAEKAYRKVEEAANEAYNQRNYQEALKHYKKAADMAPDNAVAWSNLARGYTGMKDLKKTNEAAQKAAALEPHQFGTLQDDLHGWMKYEEGWDHLERREFEKAIRILSESAKLNPSSANTYYALAMAYGYSGNDAQALQHVEQALTLKPGDTESLNLKRILENRRGISSAP